VDVLLKWKPPQNVSVSNKILKYTVTVSRLNFKNGGLDGGIPGIDNAAHSLSTGGDMNGTFFHPEKHIREFTYNSSTLPPYELPGVSKTSCEVGNWKYELKPIYT
jgi:hypothetical protein